MKTKKIIIFLMFLILRCELFAQDIINSDKDIVQYLQQVKELDDNGDERCSVYAVNLLTLEGFTASDKCGLYRIGAMASHASVYLMWLDDGQKYFIDCKRDLSETLRKVFDLWEKSKCEISDSDRLFYIKWIISTFDNNQPNSD